MPESAPPPEDITGLSLAEIARMVKERRLPPVETWDPDFCGHSAMRIARDGTWFHEGAPIDRPAMVRLFSTVLRREADGSYALVTPVEKLTIDVEDAPFIAVEVKSDGEGRDRRIAFRLNTGDLVTVDARHNVRFEQRNGSPHPYLHVRAGLEALIARPVYYELAELALAENNDPPGLWSNGTFLALTA